MPSNTIINSAFGLDIPFELAILFLLPILAVSLFYTKAKPRYAWILLAVASLSNLYDRWRYGGVIDYINLYELKFNLTDIIICWLIYIIIKNQLKSVYEND